MTDREKLYHGLSQAAWGYFFLSFDFNLNSVSVLPRFVGWLLLLSAVGKLSGERRDLALLRPLCVLLAAWDGVDWLLSWGGGDLDGTILFLELLVTVAVLYFHFQFLTDMAALAARYQPEGETLDQRLYHRRTLYTVLTTAGILAGRLALRFPGEAWLWLLGAVAVVGCVAALLVIISLFQLRRYVREGQETDGGDLQ